MLRVLHLPVNADMRTQKLDGDRSEVQPGAASVNDPSTQKVRTLLSALSVIVRLPNQGG